MAEDNKENLKIQKINFFKKMWYSMSKFEKYPEMAAEGLSRAFAYLAGIMLIFSIIVCSALLYKTHLSIKDGIEYIENEIPNITYNNGKLSVDSKEPIIINDTNWIIDKIIIDTNTEDNSQIQEYIDSFSMDEVGAIVLNDRILIKANQINNEETYKYEEIFKSVNINSLNKQELIDNLKEKAMVPAYLLFFVFSLVSVFGIYAMSVIIDTLLIAILGRITLMFAKLRLKFVALYNMAIYSLTISILLNSIYIAINTITGFELKYFHVMYTSIAYVCLVAAIFMIRIDLEKRQAELMKILEEQKKVREEMEQQKKEEEKEENKKPENDKEKKKEKDEKKPKDDEEPTGSEA